MPLRCSQKHFWNYQCHLLVRTFPTLYWPHLSTGYIVTYFDQIEYLCLFLQKTRKLLSPVTSFEYFLHSYQNQTRNFFEYRKNNEMLKRCLWLSFAAGLSCFGFNLLHIVEVAAKGFALQSAKMQQYSSQFREKWIEQNGKTVNRHASNSKRSPPKEVRGGKKRNQLTEQSQKAKATSTSMTVTTQQLEPDRAGAENTRHSANSKEHMSRRQLTGT